MRVFISHTFTDEDKELAFTLQSVLAEKNIDGYLAERRKEYDLLIRDKIRNEIENSDYIVGIVTNKAKESASVNQELGYALRAEVRVIIMLEENAKNGVFTHGIECEEFTRKDFESSCLRVRNHISEKGIRAKITDKDKQDLIDNVYRPCYNQMMNVYDRELLTYIPENPWDKIERFWKLKTESDIKLLFEQYSNEVKKWTEILIIDFGNKFMEKKEKLGEILKPIFEKYGLLDGTGRIMIGKWSNPPREWLHNSQYVIFNENILDREELYQILRGRKSPIWRRILTTLG